MAMSDAFTLAEIQQRLADGSTSFDASVVAWLVQQLETCSMTTNPDPRLAEIQQIFSLGLYRNREDFGDPSVKSAAGAIKFLLNAVRDLSAAWREAREIAERSVKARQIAEAELGEARSTLKAERKDLALANSIKSAIQDQLDLSAALKEIRAQQKEDYDRAEIWLAETEKLRAALDAERAKTQEQEAVIERATARWTVLDHELREARSALQAMTEYVHAHEADILAGVNDFGELRPLLSVLAAPARPQESR